jgi:hypothetical protein
MSFLPFPIAPSVSGPFLIEESSFYHIWQEESAFNFDDFVKSPAAALRFNFVVAATKGPHSSVFARLVPPVVGELFTKPSSLRD